MCVRLRTHILVHNTIAKDEERTRATRLQKHSSANTLSAFACVVDWSVLPHIGVAKEHLFSQMKQAQCNICEWPCKKACLSKKSSQIQGSMMGVALVKNVAGFCWKLGVVLKGKPKGHQVF